MSNIILLCYTYRVIYLQISIMLQSIMLLINYDDHLTIKPGPKREGVISR